MAKLRMLTGSHGRFEDGEHVIYRAGDEFEGTERDVEHLVNHVGSAELVGAPARKPKPATEHDVSALDGNLSAVRKAVAKIKDADHLRALLDAEEADKDRDGARDAINERLAELEA